MLNEKFENLLKELSEVNFESKPVLFSRETFFDLEEFSEFGGLDVVSRQRYASNGLIDSLIIQTDRKTAQLFGIWLLAAVFQRKHSIYCLRLTSAKDFVNEIKLVLENPSKLIVEPVGFEWEPANIEEFVSGYSHYLGDIPCMYLTNNSREWLSNEEYQSRNVIEIVSSIGGAVFLAEFFLNIGIDQSDVNYEYLKYEYAKCLLSTDSCEARVEVCHEIADEKPIISAAIN